MTLAKRKKKNKYIALTEEEISNIPLIEWGFKESSSQQHLLTHSWNTNNHSTIYALLKLCKEKGNKYWITNIRRALHTFKPDDYDSELWNKFHDLFRENTNEKEYENASVIILPIIASISLEKAYKIFKENIFNIAKKDKNYGGPSLRSITVLLQICCSNIEKGNDKEKSIGIALDLYKLSVDYKLDLTISASTAYFNHLFSIFAFNSNCIDDFNVLFSDLTKNDHNKILTETTSNALKMYFKTIDNIEIQSCLIADLNGYLFCDDIKLDIKLPRFRLSVLENSEIWDQLRLTQINDESVVKYEGKQLLLNKSRMEKLGIFGGDSVAPIAIFNKDDCDNHRRKRKYDQFVKFMVNDGGAQVIIDGANVGHMIKQDCFCFDFIDHIASYYAKNKKVRIIMTIYRVNNAENCNNERVRNIIKKWMENKWLIKVPNQLYDDVLWSIYALHSCLIYDGKVMIITNDYMKDHKMAFNQKRLFEEFLETKLCRIEIFKEKERMYYDPFDKENVKTLKRKHDFEDDAAIKKQKLNTNESIIINPHHNFHSKYQYIHDVFPYKMHEPYSYVIKPQFYQYQIQNNNQQKWEELVWFLPQMSNTSDCKNPLNLLKQTYSNWIIQKRIRWIVARVRRPIL